ncbi:hypothetical protein Q5M53_02575 [Acinetobacter baumannii]|nr:hypothetical protein [Acinetobacter baumannii]
MDKKALLEQFKAEVEASGTSLTHILKMCEFDEVSNDFRSEEVHDYSIGCLNGAWWMFQRQQAKVEEASAKAQMCRDEKNHAINRWSAVCKERDKLQKRLDVALKETQYALQYVEDDMRGNHEFLKMAMIRVFKDLEQALKGEGND